MEVNCAEISLFIHFQNQLLQRNLRWQYFLISIQYLKLILSFISEYIINFVYSQAFFIAF